MGTSEYLPRPLEEIGRLNSLPVGSEVLVGSTRYSIDAIWGNVVNSDDCSRWSVGIRQLYTVILSQGDRSLRYNSWHLSKIAGPDARDSITTNAASIDPSFKVTIPD